MDTLWRERKAYLAGFYDGRREIGDISNAVLENYWLRFLAQTNHKPLSGADDSYEKTSQLTEKQDML